MKTLKLITSLVILLLFGTLNAKAQQNQNRGKDMMSAIENLTAEQQQLIQEQRNLIMTNREHFRASLTEEQLAVINNRDLARDQRHDALMGLLTDAQQAMLREHKEVVQDIKEQFRMSLSTEQRQQMTMRLREMMGGSHDANELRESVREMRRQKGSGSGPGHGMN